MIGYRRAAVDDVPVLHVMVQALSDEDGGKHPVGSAQSLLQNGFGNRPLFHAAIAEDAVLAVGMVIYYPDYSTHRGQSGIYVQDIYDDVSARGVGVGRGLLAFMLQMQDWNARYITLGVSPENAKASGFYTRLGFTARGYHMMILAGPAFDDVC